MNINWRRLILEDSLLNSRILVKTITQARNEVLFCGTLTRTKTTYVVKNNGSYHYFRANAEYYYINIDEIK